VHALLMKGHLSSFKNCDGSNLSRLLLNQNIASKLKGTCESAEGWKSFFALEKDLITAQAKKVRLMSDKLDKHNIDLLKEMVNERKPGEPVEEVLAVFCQRQGVSMGTCRVYYKKLVDKGEIKEK